MASASATAALTPFVLPVGASGGVAETIGGLTPDQQWLAGLVYGVLFLAGMAVDLLLLIWVLNRPPRLESRLGRLLRRPFDLADGALVLAVLVGLVLAGGILAMMVSLEGAAGLALQSLLLHWLLLGLFAFALRRRGLSPWRAFGLRRRRLGRDMALGVGAYLAMVPLFLLCVFLYGLVLHLLGVEPRPQPVLDLLAGEGRPLLLAYLVFDVVVLAPMAEELVFRGIALPVLARRLGIGPAIAVVSVFFAIIHFHVEAVVPLFVAAACFSAAYALTGRLAVSMVMHGLFNGVNLAVILIAAT